MMFTGEAARISLPSEAGVGPKKMQKALPGGQIAQFAGLQNVTGAAFKLRLDGDGEVDLLPPPVRPGTRGAMPREWPAPSPYRSAGHGIAPAPAVMMICSAICPPRIGLPPTFFQQHGFYIAIDLM